MSSVPKRFTYGEQPSQFGDLRLPDKEGPHPVVITIHGGFWKARTGLSSLDALAEDLTARGLATWNIEYRRIGEEGGGWPGTMTDVARATDYLRQIAPACNLDLSKVLVVGHSAGGQLGLWLAARSFLPKDSLLRTEEAPLLLHAVVSLAGVCDFELMELAHSMQRRREDFPVRELLGGTMEEVPERYAQASPIQLLPPKPKQLLIHGALDINVPIGISDSYLRAARAAGIEVELLELPTAEHYKIIRPESDVWPSIAQAILDSVYAF